MDLTLATELGTQMGTAALLGWMWMSERRASARRERLLEEAHARVLEQCASAREVARALDATAVAVDRNARAVDRLDRGVGALLARMLGGRDQRAEAAD
ncbi:MAG: hypothetical protein SFY95_12425 [Planctomycetota bacterium]|nr:hypothetical protein [Planctomycetota bacterium]